MAAYASLTIPVALGTPELARKTRELLESTIGTISVALDETAGTATIGYQFPGNINKVMEKLGRRNLSTAEWMTVAIPIRNLSGMEVDAGGLCGELNESPAISGARLDDHTLTATVATETDAMRYIMERLTQFHLTPMDVPTPAALDDYTGWM